MDPKEEAFLNSLKKYFGGKKAKLRDVVTGLAASGDISVDAAVEFLEKHGPPQKKTSAPTTRAQTVMGSDEPIIQDADPVMPAYDPCAPPYSGAIRHQPSCDTPPSRRTDPCGGGGRGRISSSC